MGCCEFSWLWLVLAFLFYKLIDLLIRLPMRSRPSPVVNNILVTGCDSGFGRVTALRLDKKGFNVFAACLTEEGKEGLIKASGSGRINAFLMDVTQTESIEAAYDRVCKSLPVGAGLWGIVNNAGMMQPGIGPLEWMKKQDFQACCDVNLLGMAEVIRVFLPLVKKTKGRIVCTSSTAGIIGFSNFAPYSASKFAVEGLCSSIRLELAVFGIKVLIIVPGFHRTNLWDFENLNKLSKKSWNRLSEDLKKEYTADYATKSFTVMRYMIEKFSSSRLDDVVDAYEHALLSYFPRGKYLVGKDANYILWPLSNLPEWVYTEVITRNKDRPIPKSCQ